MKPALGHPVRCWRKTSRCCAAIRLSKKVRNRPRSQGVASAAPRSRNGAEMMGATCRSRIFHASAGAIRKRPNSTSFRRSPNGRIFGSRGGESRWSRLFHVPLRLSRFSLSSRLDTKPTSRCRLTTSTIGVEPHRPVPKTTTSIRRMPSQPCIPGYLSLGARRVRPVWRNVDKGRRPAESNIVGAPVRGGLEAGPGACRASETGLHRGGSPSLEPIPL